MIKKTYQLQLASPAFLGGADQSGVWRTPPLKALIREWWRLAVAPECGYDTRALKQREAALFGTAADGREDGNQQSRLRLALHHWQSGKCTEWPTGESRVVHPEVKRGGKPVAVGSELYLGFGPLIPDRGTKLKHGAALQAQETNQLRLAVPDHELAGLIRALSLANWFGTIGGRSRNGWGSLLWRDQDDDSRLPLLSRAALEQTGCTRALDECLTLDWPHAIGTDDTGTLVWRSRESFPDWRAAMTFLAKTKIAFRTELEFTTGDDSPRVEGRHLLAHPVTHHRVEEWGKDARLANTLRFKLIQEADNALHALIYHTPCKPSSTLPHRYLDPLAVWQRVHRHLDAASQLARLA